VRKWLSWVEELLDILHIELVLFGYGSEFVLDVFGAVQNPISMYNLSFASNSSLDR